MQILMKKTTEFSSFRKTAALLFKTVQLLKNITRMWYPGFDFCYYLIKRFSNYSLHSNIIKNPSEMASIAPPPSPRSLPPDSAVSRKLRFWFSIGKLLPVTLRISRKSKEFHDKDIRTDIIQMCPWCWRHQFQHVCSYCPLCSYLGCDQIALIRSPADIQRRWILIVSSG